MADETPSSGSSTPDPDTVRSAAQSDESPGGERPSLIDAFADLLQTFVDWARTEAEDLTREKVVLPLQKLGLTLASGTAAGCLFVFGVGFISVGLLILLATWLTWPGALILIGVVLCIGAAVFTVIKVRSMQHDLPADEQGTGKPAVTDAPGTPPRDPRRAS